MSQRSVTLNLPEDLYESVHDAAEASERPIEFVLVESLQVLFQSPSPDSDLDAELAKLPDYTDAQLWAVFYRRLPWDQSLRVRELNARQKFKPLPEIEREELESLVDLTDRYMLLRSEALLLLKRRGNDIESYQRQFGGYHVKLTTR